MLDKMLIVKVPLLNTCPVYISSVYKHSPDTREFITRTVYKHSPDTREFITRTVEL